MPSSHQTIQVSPTGKGLYSGIAPDLVPPDGWASMLNFRSRRGRLERVQGIDQFDPTDLTLAEPVLNIASYEKRSGSVWTMFQTKPDGVGTGHLYSYTGGTKADRTPAGGFTGTNSLPYSAAVLNDLFICGNPTDGLFKWDGVAANATTIGTSPHPHFLVNFANRLVAGRVGDYPFRVQWSGIDDPETWDSGNAQDLTDDPGPITGMAVLTETMLAVAKERRIYVFEQTGDEATFSQHPRVIGTGAIGLGNFVAVNGIAYFLGSDNVYRWDGVSQPQPIGDPIIQDFFDNTNPEHLGKVRMYHYERENEILLCHPQTIYTEPLHAYVLDHESGTWGYRVMPGRAAANVTATQELTFDTLDTIAPTFDGLVAGGWHYFDQYALGARNLRFLCGDENGDIFKLDESTTYLGTELRAFADTGDRTIFGRPNQVSYVMGLRVITDAVMDPQVGANLTLYVLTGERPGQLQTVGTYTASLEPNGEGVFYFRHTGRWFRFRLEAISGVPFAITGYEVYAMPAGRR